MNKYEVGDAVRCTVTFYDLAGAVADPTTVVAQYRNGTGAITTLTYGTDAALVKQATGIYYVDISPTAAGTWYWGIKGTGTVIAAFEGAFSVTTRF